MTITEHQLLEERRLEKLYSYGILDTGDERAFNQIADDLSLILKVPTVLLSFMDRERQWFKATIEFNARETTRQVAFCSYTILSDEPLVIEDATQDDRFADNPLVTGDPHIRAYAGVPLVSPDGYRIGTICSVDYQPRTFTEWEIEVLRRFARRVMNELEQRLLRHEFERVMRHLQTVMNLSEQGMVFLNQHGLVVGANKAAEDIAGMGWDPGLYFDPTLLQSAGQEGVYRRWDGEGTFSLREKPLNDELKVILLEKTQPS